MSSETFIQFGEEFTFIEKYKDLITVLSDHELAALGDAYVNFIYSLSLSKKIQKPTGKKVDNFTLALALKKAGLRKLLPSRIDRHMQANAAEALIVYAWLTGALSLKETLDIMEKEETAEDAFSLLLQLILKKINLSHDKI